MPLLLLAPLLEGLLRSGKLQTRSVVFYTSQTHTHQTSTPGVLSSLHYYYYTHSDTGTGRNGVSDLPPQGCVQ